MQLFIVDDCQFDLQSSSNWIETDWAEKDWTNLSMGMILNFAEAVVHLTVKDTKVHCFLTWNQAHLYIIMSGLFWLLQSN